jgi:hypothetical protein
MTERSSLLARAAPAASVLILAAAALAGAGRGLAFASPDRAAADRFSAALAAVEPDSLVLVAFDPDLGTYAEVRPTVRSALTDLLRRQSRLAVVSLTPEGRALAAAELGRLAALGADMSRVSDLGFRPGAEAALVAIARSAAGEGHDAIGGVPSLTSDPPALVLVVGGNDLGPRSWVEQVQPRVPGLPIVAITPTVLLPEARPYLVSGQLAALLETPRDGAAYRDALRLGSSAALAELDDPPAVGVFVGLLIAIGAIGIAVGRRVMAAASGGSRREVA